MISNTGALLYGSSPQLSITSAGRTSIVFSGNSAAEIWEWGVDSNIGAGPGIFIFDQFNTITPQAFLSAGGGTYYQILTNGGSVIGWDANATFAGSSGADTAFSKLAAASVAIGNGTPGDFSGALKLTNLHLAPVAIASLPGSPTAGDIAVVNDALAPVPGSPVGAGGGAYAMVWWNNAAWNVFAV